MNRIFYLTITSMPKTPYCSVFWYCNSGLPSSIRAQLPYSWWGFRCRIYYIIATTFCQEKPGAEPQRCRTKRGGDVCLLRDLNSAQTASLVQIKPHRYFRRYSLCLPTPSAFRGSAPKPQTEVQILICCPYQKRAPVRLLLIRMFTRRGDMPTLVGGSPAGVR